MNTLTMMSNHKGSMSFGGCCAISHLIRGIKTINSFNSVREDFHTSLKEYMNCRSLMNVLHSRALYENCTSMI